MIATLTKIWKPIIFIVGLALVIAFIVICIAAIISFFFSFRIVSNFIANSTLSTFIGMSNALFILTIPMLAIIFLISRISFKRKVNNKWKAGMWAFWVVNLISFGLIALFLSAQFNRQGEAENWIDLSAVYSDTLTIEVNRNPYNDVLMNFGDLKLADDQLIVDNVYISIKKSEDNDFRFKRILRSRGRTLNDALDKANSVNSSYQVSEGKIILDPVFTIDKGNKWRGQQIQYVLEVPEGKAIKCGTGSNRLHFQFIPKDRTVDNPWHQGEGQLWEAGANGFICRTYQEENNNEKSFDYSDFSKLRLEGRYKVDIRKGNKFSVKLKGRKDRIKDMQVEKIGNALEIVNEYHSHHHNRDEKVYLDITMPNLSLLDMENVDEVSVRGFQQKNMSVIHEGNHKVTMRDMDIDSLYLNIKRNTIDIRGTGKYLNVKVDDGSLDAEHFAVKVLDVKAYNARERMRLNVQDTLYQDIEHSREPNIDGNPVIIDRRKEDID